MTMSIKQKNRGVSTALYATLLVTGLLTACSSSDDDMKNELTDQPGNSDMGSMPSPTDQPGNPDMGSMPSPTNDLVPTTFTTAANGDIYVDANQQALYTRYTDAPGNISCDATCMLSWAPLTTSVTSQGISGNFDVVTLDDGSSQWTLLGYPLFLFGGDATQGDIMGDNVDNQWALARPIPTDSGSIGGEEALVAMGATRADGITDTRIDRSGFTLYFFDNDTTGISTCNGSCASNWPPLYADRGAQADGDRYTIVSRDDGTLQWAYDGKALYYWQGDNAAGEATGANVPNWRIATP